MEGLARPSLGSRLEKSQADVGLVAWEPLAVGSFQCFLRGDKVYHLSVFRGPEKTKQKTFFFPPWSAVREQQLKADQFQGSSLRSV